MKSALLEVAVATKRLVAVPKGQELGTSQYICHAIEKVRGCSFNIEEGRACRTLAEQVMVHLHRLHQATFNGLADKMLAARESTEGRYELSQRLRHEWLDAKIKELS